MGPGSTIAGLLNFTATAAQPYLMKKPVSKNQLRRELDQQMDDFLRTGGKVTRVDQGVTGRDDPARPHENGSTLFGPRPEKRVYVPEVIATLERRRQERKGSKAPRPGRRAKKPRKKMIYDDFGEPLRWVWEEE